MVDDHSKLFASSIEVSDALKAFKEAPGIQSTDDILTFWSTSPHPHHHHPHFFYVRGVAWVFPSVEQRLPKEHLLEHAEHVGFVAFVAPVVVGADMIIC